MMHHHDTERKLFEACKERSDEADNHKASNKIKIKVFMVTGGTSIQNLGKGKSLATVKNVNIN